jgi:hypothetical protein
MLALVPSGSEVITSAPADEARTSKTADTEYEAILIRAPKETFESFP